MITLMLEDVPTLEVAPGSVVVVRDEEWLVTQARTTSDGLLIHVQGLSELVRGQTATFYESLDRIEVLDPKAATVRADNSPNYRDARLWLEATIRKTPLPLTDERLTVAHDALADPLSYQHKAVQRALSPESLRPRLLIADAVGLGKTLEIGMVLSELIRRGRGDRILIVCPRHVLEQMQHEMWTRFAIPFVRLDSIGVQRVKQKLPATRNPFTYFNRVIISMDTLKQERFSHDLRKHQWDAVVIDESHNITNSATQNNRLARTLAPNTDALLLASATPHNGKEESFSELIRLLEPTAVSPEGKLNHDDVEKLVIRRHRHSEEVANVVGADWAERKPIQHRLVPASPAEDTVAQELADVWLYPQHGSPYSGQGKLFQWVLAKAFLSSPAALRATAGERLRRLDGASDDTRRERDALSRLIELNDATFDQSSKYQELVNYLRGIGIKKGSDTRAVVFSERVDTLHYLQERLQRDLKFTSEQVRILHGGLNDVEQQEIVESFKQTHSPIRVLVTGDVASEGVNLHKQCHHLIHYDIPWSLIRIEQRNGRIDRYGQKTPPQITALLLQPLTDRFSGDVRVLTRLLKKEEEAHKSLGDAASLMGQYSVAAEEKAIAEVLAGNAELDEVVQNPDDILANAAFDPFAAILAGHAFTDDVPETSAEPAAHGAGLYANDVDFLREAVNVVSATPHASTAKGGLEWKEHPQDQSVEFKPPADLRQRLEVLPQSYLKDRGVTDVLRLATTKQKGKQLLQDALTDSSDSTWPTAHYLGPLHPVLDWAADQALANLVRNEVFVVRSAVDTPHVLLVGTLTNRNGQTVAVSWVDVEFPTSNPGFAMAEIAESPAELFERVCFTGTLVNPGGLQVDEFQSLIPPAVESAEAALSTVMDAATRAAEERIERWSARSEHWQEKAAEVAQRELVRARRMTVAQEQQVIEDMRPTRQLVRPLLVVVPKA